jgi:tungstate transport system substrate-binding protein
MSVLLIFPFSLPLAGDHAHYKQIIIATGSPFELGLITVLGKAFEKEQGCTVRCIKTPTDPGLELGKNGLTHITMGHDPKATEEFAKGGYAAKRTGLMHNYTIIIGPANDPAKIAGLTDLKEAHKKIAATGAKYLSRGDGGGMNLLELRIWKELGFDPGNKGWYEVSKVFMLESMLNSDKNGQYHMLDSSTWVMHRSKVPNLRLMEIGRAHV